MNFNEAQMAAICHKSGPALILAGPGSGKTTVITRRVKTLIEEQSVLPSNILVVTFTKMAAKEMKERFDKLMEGKVCPVVFGTFHSVFFTILKNAYGYRAENVIAEEKQRAFIKKILDRHASDFEYEDENEFVSAVLAEISKVKSERMDLEIYYSISCSENMFRAIYKDYHKELNRNKLIDFDDMLVLCYELLLQREDILKAWQNKFQYILIDEFQDINRLQYDTVRLLSKQNKNVFAVGDDDQSIYGFRGAKPEIMLNFRQDFPGMKEITLNVNYRSAENIVNAAKSMIGHNTKRFFKDIKATKDAGRFVEIKQFSDITEENHYIIKQIQEYIKQEVPLSEMAVLTRTNIGARQILEKLIEYNIPVTTRDAIPNIYEHWIAGNIFSYIRLALGNRERAEFLKVMNKPKRYISREAVEQPVDFENLRKIYEDKPWMVQRLDELESDLFLISKMNPFAAINYIRRKIGYDEYLREYANERKLNEEDLQNDIGEIQEASRNFSAYTEWFTHIEMYTKELARQKELIKKQTDAVSVCTMHSAKGLEYRAVFIPDVNAGIVPHHKAVLDAEIEEERRMFYVAMTRAKEHLHIFSTRERYNKKQELSGFILEIDDKYISKDIANRE